MKTKNELQHFIHDMGNELGILYNSLNKLKIMNKADDLDVKMVETVIEQMKKTMKESMNICEETLNPKAVDCDMNTITKRVIEEKKDNYGTKIKVISMESIMHKVSPTLYKNVVHNIIKNASEANARDLTVLIEDRSISFIDNGDGLSEDNLKKMISKELTSTKSEDRGVGLKSIAQFCKKFNIKLSFSHNMPRGLVVKLNFPKK